MIAPMGADPTSYLAVHPDYQPFLGTNLVLGPTPNPNITGDRSYTRAHFIYYAGVVTPGIYRWAEAAYARGHCLIPRCWGPTDDPASIETCRRR